MTMTRGPGAGMFMRGAGYQLLKQIGVVLCVGAREWSNVTVYHPRLLIFLLMSEQVGEKN